MSLADHRPRSVAELVDASFNLYRANAAAIITAAMLVVAPPAILKALAPAALERLIDLIGNLLVPLAQGAITVCVASIVERDGRPDAGHALREASARAGSLIGVQILSGVMVVIGMVLLLVPGVIAAIWTAVCLPAVVIERVGVSRAIERSRALVRDRWMHVLGTLLLAWGIALVFIVGAGMVLGLLGPGDRISTLLVDLLFGLVYPIPAIAVTLLYYDLRVRTESADIDAMLSALPVAETT